MAVSILLSWIIALFLFLFPSPIFWYPSLSPLCGLSVDLALSSRAPAKQARERSVYATKKNHLCKVYNQTLYVAHVAELLSARVFQLTATCTGVTTVTVVIWFENSPAVVLFFTAQFGLVFWTVWSISSSVVWQVRFWVCTIEQVDERGSFVFFRGFQTFLRRVYAWTCVV